MIAILGATGLIGGSLGRWIAGRGEAVVLFARETDRLKAETWPDAVHLRSLSEFRGDEFDLVINALGAGDPQRVATLGADILDISYRWDRRVLKTMGPRTRYVFLSSGAIYGAFEAPGNESSELRIPVNRLRSVSAYSIAKLHAEVRHRHLQDRAILDVRIFSYADPRLSLNGKFFLSELARSIVTKAQFATTDQDLIRDYAGVEELDALIQCWVDAGSPNTSLDLYSRAPVGKFELLDEVRRRFGTAIRFDATAAAAPTGIKPAYYSLHHAAAAFGYSPQRSALEVVLDTLEELCRDGSRIANT